MSEEIEIWRPVKDWEGLYEVSSLGRVRTIGRSVPHGVGAGMRRLEAKVVSTPICANGYPYVHLGEPGRRDFCTVHSLVAEAFIGPRPEGLQVRHADGNRANPAESNLSYGTQVDNCADMQLHGTQLQGDDHPWSQLTERAVRAIRADCRTYAQIAADYPVSWSGIAKIKHRRSWKHVA